MRDLILVVIILGSMPFAFLKPYVGIYLWYWVGLLNPHRFTWGFMHDFPVAQIIGAGTIAGSFFTKQRAPLLRTREMAILLCLTFLFTINTYFALFPTAWGEWQKMMKVLVMTFLTVILINERQKLRILLMVVAISIGIVAVKGAIWGVATSAEFRLWGPEGSTLGDNNSMGLALNMLLPIALFLARSEERKWSRLVFYGIFVSSIFGVVLTYSRGALLGLAAVLTLLLYRARKNPVLVVAMIGVFAAVLAFIPSTWFDRMNTIKTYEEDASAMIRIQTWHFAWDLATSRPLTGGGFDGFRANPSNQNPHSIYFGMLGEQGFLALGLFLLLMVSSLQTLGKVARRSERMGIEWYADCARALRVSLIGYAVSGAFLNLEYFDLFYLIIAIVAILVYLVRKEAMALAAQAEADNAA